MELSKIKQMANHVTNSMMAHLSNEIYFDYREDAEEQREFNEFMTGYVKFSLESAAKTFVEQRQFQAEQKECQAKLDAIVESLQKWCDERNLTKDQQKENLLSNVLEELTELARARTLNEIVDALCDICVFAINANSDRLFYQHSGGCKLFDGDAKFNFIAVIMQNIQYDRFDDIVYSCFGTMQQLGYDPFKAMNETIKEICSRTGKWDDKLGKFVKDAGVYSDSQSLTEFEKSIFDKYPDDNVSFDFRNNEVDVIIDYGKEIITYKLWYKADYNKCKLEV